MKDNLQGIQKKEEVKEEKKEDFEELKKGKSNLMNKKALKFNQKNYKEDIILPKNDVSGFPGLSDAQFNKLSKKDQDGWAKLKEAMARHDAYWKQQFPDQEDKEEEPVD